MYSRHPSSQQHFSAPAGGSWGFLSPDGMYCVIPPASSGSTSGSPLSWMCPEDLQRDVPRRHPNQMPKTKSAGSFLLRGAALLWAPSGSLRQSPGIPWMKLILAICIQDLILFVTAQPSWVRVTPSGSAVFSPQWSNITPELHTLLGNTVSHYTVTHEQDQERNLNSLVYEKSPPTLRERSLLPAVASYLSE